MDRDYILIRRTDEGGNISPNYTGHLRGDHYEGTIVWSRPDHPGESTGSWTGTVRDTTCSEQHGMEAADALRVGGYALMFHRDRDALTWQLAEVKRSLVARGLTLVALNGGGNHLDPAAQQRFVKIIELAGRLGVSFIGGSSGAIAGRSLDEQTLDNSAGKQLLSAEIVEDQFAVMAK